MAEDAGTDSRTDESLREFIFKHYVGGDIAMIDGRILVENMQHIFKWVREGLVPELSTRMRNKLSVVPKGDST